MLAPPCSMLPGWTYSMLLPMLLIWFCTIDCAPWPMETIAMTAPTPIMMPSIVNADRILLRPRARMATLRMARKFIVVLFGFGRWQFLQGLGSIFPILDRHIASNAPVAELNNACAVLSDIRFVGDENDRQ